MLLRSLCLTTQDASRTETPDMPHVISQKCIAEVYAACQQVCPADTMHYVAQMPAGYPAVGQAMMVINPDECIDCGVCEPECPVDAIKPDTEDTPDGKWLRINTEYAKVWPNITLKGEPPENAADFERETGKFEKYFSEKPGKGS